MLSVADGIRVEVEGTSWVTAKGHIVARGWVFHISHNGGMTHCVIWEPHHKPLGDLCLGKHWMPRRGMCYKVDVGGNPLGDKDVHRGPVNSL